MKIFLSDLHLGDGSKAEDFYRDDLLLNLLDYAENKATKVILLGDIYELWQCSLEDIYWAHPKVISKLKSMKNVTYTYGNHDYVPFSKFCSEIYQDDKVVAMHGHQYDIFNRYKNPLFNLKWPVGKWITILVGEMERWVSPNIDTWLLKMKERLGELNVERAKIQNKSYDYTNLDQLASVSKKLRNTNLGPISIFGHTHDSDLSIIEENGKKRIYANTGSWVNDCYPTFIEVADKWIRLCDGNDLDVIKEVKLDVL